MAAMTALDPAPAVPCLSGQLIATEAGRSAAGLLASVHLVQDAIKAARVVKLLDPADREAFAHEAAAATAIDASALVAALLALAPAVEAALRQAPPRRSARAQEAAPAADVPNQVADILDEAPATIRRPLCLIGEHAYAVT